MIGGLLFTGLHLTEWFNMITKENFTITSNPEGTPLFGAVFFGITGLHMTHVMIGVIYLGIVAVGYGRGKLCFASHCQSVTGSLHGPHGSGAVRATILPLRSSECTARNLPR